MTTTTKTSHHYKYEHAGAKRKRILSDQTSHHPAVVQLAMKHAASIQLRIADAITNFAGSMRFVYIHAVLFLAWMGFNLLAPHGFDKYPFGLLTLIVSLEAIFLSTFVMIGQNRQAAFQQNKADHDFATEHQELHENTVLTKQIFDLTCKLEGIEGDMKKILENQQKQLGK